MSTEIGGSKRLYVLLPSLKWTVDYLREVEVTIKEAAKP